MNVHEVSNQILLKESKNQLEASPVYDWTSQQAEECYQRVTLDALKKLTPRIPVAIDYEKNEALVTNLAHSLVIGYTGSGKDQVFAWNILDLWYNFDSKPSLVVYDYKSEMQRQFVEKYVEMGYDVYIYDTRNASASDSYNPFLIIYDSYHAALEIKKRQKKGASRFGCEFDGVTYPSSEAAYKAAHAKHQEYMDTVYKRINTFVLKAVVDDPKNMSWILGERALVAGMIMMMLHDSESPKLTGMTRDRFTIKTLSNVMNAIMVNPDTYTEWLQYGKHIFEVHSALSIMSSRAQSTRDSYVTGAMMAIARYANRQISLLTRTENSIDIKKIARSNKPTVIFITCQEDQEIANDLCMDFLGDMIEELKTVADKNRGGSLDRDWLFLLNEFGNMPKIPNFQTKITTLRSYRIWMFMEVQSYEQIVNIYGKENAATIIGNCDYTFFLGSASYETNKTFGAMMGLRPDVETSASIARGELQISKRATNVPNVRISDIEALKIGEFYLQTSPKYLKLKSYMTPYFERDGVEICHSAPKEYSPFILSEENYDIEKVVEEYRKEEQKKKEMEEERLRKKALKETSQSEEPSPSDSSDKSDSSTASDDLDDLFDKLDSFSKPPFTVRRPMPFMPRPKGFSVDEYLERLNRQSDDDDSHDELDLSDHSDTDWEQEMHAYQSSHADDLIREVIRDNPTVSKMRCVKELRKKLECVTSLGSPESVLDIFRMALRRVTSMSNKEFIVFRSGCSH